MKKDIIFLVLLISFYSCSTNGDTKSCEQFKKGKFLVTMDTAPYTPWIINREDSVQIEVNQVTNDSIINAITWTGSCEYELKFLRAVGPRKDSINSVLKSKPLKVNILETHKDYYIFRMSINGIDLAPADTLKVFPK